MERKNRTQDGLLLETVPLYSVIFLGRADIEARVAPGGTDERIYVSALRAIELRQASIIPIVYRAPNGKLIASSLSHSDIVIYAEQKTPRSIYGLPAPSDPKLRVKVMDVESMAHLKARTLEYIDANPASDREQAVRAALKRIDEKEVAGAWTWDRRPVTDGPKPVPSDLPFVFPTKADAKAAKAKLKKLASKDTTVAKRFAMIVVRIGMPRAWIEEMYAFKTEYVEYTERPA